jgi:hypothetical protein
MIPARDVSEQDQEAAASVPRGPLLTFDRGDEAVGVDEADRQRPDLTPEE